MRTRMNRSCAVLALGCWLAAATTLQANDGPRREPAGDPAASCCNNACTCASCPHACGDRRGCLRKLWDWLTYRPLPVPRCCKGFKPAGPCCTPPVYAYFLPYDTMGCNGNGNGCRPCAATCQPCAASCQPCASACCGPRRGLSLDRLNPLNLLRKTPCEPCATPCATLGQPCAITCQEKATPCSSSRLSQTLERFKPMNLLQRCGLVRPTTTYDEVK